MMMFFFTAKVNNADSFTYGAYEITSKSYSAYEISSNRLPFVLSSWKLRPLRVISNNGVPNKSSVRFLNLFLVL